MERNDFNIEGQLLFVEPKWVTGETCISGIQDPFKYLYAKDKITKMRKSFLERLENEGFIITFEKNNMDDNTLCLIMNEFALCDDSVDVYQYKKIFDKKILLSGGEKINYPHSVTTEEYFKNPFFPAVFKNELANGGIDKFFIETEEQLEIIKKFYNDFSNDERISNLFKGSIFQQYIETPTNNKTYMRVLMSASGEVMGASLKSSIVVEKKREPQGEFEKYFWKESSKYYLNCKGMFNYYSKQENILIPQPKYSNEKRRILEVHGINPSDPKVPEDVIEVASSIMKKCNKELGIMCGMDFILNKDDNKWYYLENQAFTAIDEWAIPKGIKVPNIKTIDDYIKYNKLELDARYEALMMYMKKKNEEIKEQNIPKCKIYKL